MDPWGIILLYSAFLLTLSLIILVSRAEQSDGQFNIIETPDNEPRKIVFIHKNVWDLTSLVSGKKST
jgi:hypothetical protein